MFLEDAIISAFEDLWFVVLGDVIKSYIVEQVIKFVPVCLNKVNDLYWVIQHLKKEQQLIDIHFRKVNRVVVLLVRDADGSTLT